MPTTSPAVIEPTPEVKAMLEGFVRNLLRFIDSDIYMSHYHATAPDDSSVYDRAGAEAFLCNLDSARCQQFRRVQCFSKPAADCMAAYLIDKAVNGASAAKRRYDADEEGLPLPENLAAWTPTKKHGYIHKFGGLMIGDKTKEFTTIYPILSTDRCGKFKLFAMPVVVDGVTHNILLQSGKIHGIREWLHPSLCYFKMGGATSKAELKAALGAVISCSADMAVDCFLVNRGKGGYTPLAFATNAAAGAPPAGANAQSNADLAEGFAQFRVEINTKLDTNQQELNAKLDTNKQELNAKLDMNKQELNTRLYGNQQVLATKLGANKAMLDTNTDNLAKLCVATEGLRLANEAR